MRWFLFVTLGLVACNNQHFGQSIGRPSLPEPQVNQRQALQIREVFVATPDPAQRYVELEYTGNDHLHLDPLKLCAFAMCTTLSGELLPGERATFALMDNNTPFEISAHVGEIAVVDANGTVHAYLAWGADPMLSQSNYAAHAVVSGATEPGFFVVIPYPMPAGYAVANEEEAHGCALPSANEVAIIVNCPTTAIALHLSEILPQWTTGSDSWVEIHNAGTATLELMGVRICQPPTCVSFVYGSSLDAGQRALIHWGVAAPAVIPANEYYFSDAPGFQTRGEVVLLTPGAAVLASAPMTSYVSYGNESSSLATPANNAGLWPSSDFSAQPPRIPTETLSAVAGSTPNLFSWYPTAPTPLADNPAITEGNNVWTSCSFPKPNLEAALSDLAIRRIERASDVVVRLENRGAQTLDVADYKLKIGANEYLLPSQNLDSGVTLDVRLAASGDPCLPSELACWEDAAAFVGDAGELALIKILDGSFAHYLQWGATIGVDAPGAFLAGVWPLESCAIEAFPTGSILLVPATLSGHSPADYVVSQP